MKRSNPMTRISLADAGANVPALQQTIRNGCTPAMTPTIHTGYIPPMTQPHTMTRVTPKAAIEDTTMRMNQTTRWAQTTRMTRLYGREIRAELTRAWRTPSFMAPTLALPLMFYTLFAIVLAQPGSETPAYALATFGVMSALGPSLFGFGSGVATDRDSGILQLKQVSPLPPGAFLVARLATALAFTATVLLGMYTLAAWGAGVRLPAFSWLALAMVHLGAVVPFCLLGLCVGLGTRTSAAVALCNLLFVGLAVFGGLWIPLFAFPHWMQQFALALPTTHLAALALTAAGRAGSGGVAGHVLVVLAFSVGSAALAHRFWSRAVF